MLSTLSRYIYWFFISYKAGFNFNNKNNYKHFCLLLWDASLKILDYCCKLTSMKRCLIEEHDSSSRSKSDCVSEILKSCFLSEWIVFNSKVLRTYKKNSNTFAWAVGICGEWGLICFHVVRSSSLAVLVFPSVHAAGVSLLLLPFSQAPETSGCCTDVTAGTEHEPKLVLNEVAQ